MILLAEDPQWAWKPYNPYDVITTSITVEQWNYVLLSNWNVMFFVGLFSLGMILNWFLFILPAKRRKQDGEGKPPWEGEAK